jgi:hypothetical protein
LRDAGRPCGGTELRWLLLSRHRQPTKTDAMGMIGRSTRIGEDAWLLSAKSFFIGGKFRLSQDAPVRTGGASPHASQVRARNALATVDDRANYAAHSFLFPGVSAGEWVAVAGGTRRDERPSLPEPT